MKEEPENQRVIYQFGRFVLDPREKTLLADGQPIHLPAKEFDTLLLLVENNGRVLKKGEMLETIWPGVFVEENNLAKYVSRLRKLLNSGGEITIETLPKHGYRFSAEVNEIVQPAEETILEKRTTRRLTMRVEEDLQAAPMLARPPKRTGFPRKILFGILGLIGVTAAIGLLWRWQAPKPLAETAKSGVTFLTDGRFDDNSAYFTNQGRIYFFRYFSNTRAEAWTMNADGTNQHRANTEIKDLLVGRWSPDGKKVLFFKENDKTTYLANADGSNEIVLSFNVGNLDWSPDGSQFVYQSGSPKEKSEIFLYTLETGINVKLTDNDFLDADPSFSFDGRQIAFASMRDGNAEIYVMNADGSNVRRITNHPAFDNYPVFSPDGTQIAFQSNREDEHTEVYLQNLNDDTPPRRITRSPHSTGLVPKSWTADGTQILFYKVQTDKDQIFLANVEPFAARLVLSDERADFKSPRLSADGKQILYQAGLENRTLELRVTDLASKSTRTVFQTPRDNLTVDLVPAWSPDNSLIAFSNRAKSNTEIFTIKSDGSDLKNLSNNPLLDTTPIFSPDGSEIVFARDTYGTAHLYRMSLNGGNQRRITDKIGYEMTPSFSPDGNHLAFAGDREGRGLEIFGLDFNNPNEEKLLAGRRFHDGSPTFSPDGRKIAFIATSDGNPEIYVMNADGTGLFRLTHSKSAEGAPQFTKDGRAVLFAANYDGRFAIYEIALP